MDRWTDVDQAVSADSDLGSCLQSWTVKSWEWVPSSIWSVALFVLPSCTNAGLTLNTEQYGLEIKTY